MSDLTSLNLASISTPQPATPNTPSQPTHLTYEQAEEILGPYLDVYLTNWAAQGDANRKQLLSYSSGTWGDGDGNILPPENDPNFKHPAMSRLIRKADVLQLADALHTSGNPDPRAVNPPDWPKETRHYKKPGNAKAAVTHQAPDELIAALAYPGVNLEVFHAHGAPSVGDLQAFLDGTAQPSHEHQAQISEALARLRRTALEGR